MRYAALLIFTSRLIGDALSASKSQRAPCPARSQRPACRPRRRIGAAIVAVVIALLVALVAGASLFFWPMTTFGRLLVGSVAE
jgi:hypothetical protein